jgi:TPR repeat protein
MKKTIQGFLCGLVLLPLIVEAVGITTNTYNNDQKSTPDKPAPINAHLIRAYNAIAQYNLARQNYKEAVKWLRLAAEQGDAIAQVRLAAAYDEGKGVPQDNKEAVKWLRLAAEQGDASAQYILGLSYSTGKGLQQDYKEALKWFRLAAGKGNTNQLNFEAACSIGWNGSQSGNYLDALELLNFWVVPPIN